MSLIAIGLLFYLVSIAVEVCHCILAPLIRKFLEQRSRWNRS